VLFEYVPETSDAEMVQNMVEIDKTLGNWTTDAELELKSKDDKKKMFAKSSVRTVTESRISI
jgi:hypothetical protein